MEKDINQQEADLFFDRVKKLKILFINDLLYGGGAETIFRNTIVALNKFARDKFEIYSVSTDKINERKINWNHFFLDNSKQGILKPIKYVFNFKNYIKLKKIIYDIKPDIIHIHNFYGHLSPSILLSLKNYKSKNKDIKIIQTLHDYSIVCPNSSLYNYSKENVCELCVGHSIKMNIIWENCYGSLLYSTLKFFRSQLALSVLKHVDVIDKFIVPSLFLIKILQKEGIKLDKICHIRNPVLESIPEIDYSLKENIIIFVGRLSREKSIDTLIKAFIESDIPDWKLVIVGEGNPMEKSRLESMCNRNNNISFTGWLGRKDIEELMKKAKILVLPSSLYENQPTVVIEAIAYRVLPIVRNIGGMKELAEYFKLPKFNTYEEFLIILKETVKTVSEDSFSNCDLSQLQHFTFNMYVKNLLGLYYE